jgi:thermostable 8-oxoguanine DNA glycosylase
VIDPTKITDFNRATPQLEELLLFCIAVAGKNATVTSKNMERLLEYGRDYCDGSPFEIIIELSKRYDLKELIKDFGFGCHSVKSRGFLEAANSGLDLKICTVNQLEKIHGIGMKTSRFFLLHTRKNAGVACLDTHILQWLAKHSNLNVPKQTPTCKKYLELESVFLMVAEVLKTHPADLDLRIWNMSRGSDEESLVASLQKKK